MTDPGIPPFSDDGGRRKRRGRPGGQRGVRTVTTGQKPYNECVAIAQPVLTAGEIAILRDYPDDLGRDGNAFRKRAGNKWRPAQWRREIFRRRRMPEEPPSRGWELRKTFNFQRLVAEAPALLRHSRLALHSRGKLCDLLSHDLPGLELDGRPRGDDKAASRLVWIAANPGLREFDLEDAEVAQFHGISVS